MQYVLIDRHIRTSIWRQRWVVGALLCLCLSQVQAVDHVHLDSPDDSCAVCQHIDNTAPVTSSAEPVSAAVDNQFLQHPRPLSADVQRIGTIRSRAPPHS